MKLLFWVVAGACLAVLLTLLSQNFSTDYVEIVVWPTSIRISFSLFILCLCLTVGVLYSLVRLTLITLSLPQRVKAFQEKKKELAIQTQSQAAILAFWQGRAQASLQSAEAALSHEPNNTLRTLNALFAARASHQMRDYAKRDYYLSQINTENEEFALASYLTQAQVYLDQGDLQAALKAVSMARQFSPKLSAALLLELKIRHRLNNTPDEVLDLVELLQKSEAIDAASARHYRLSACLTQAKLHDLKGATLQEWWNEIPADERLHPKLAEAYARHALRDPVNGFSGLAILQDSLNKEWNSELLWALTAEELSQSMRTEALKFAEGLLNTHPKDATLLLVLAKLCMQLSIWGKAQNYAEASLAIHATPTAHWMLAQLLETLEKTDEAQKHYKAGLALSQEKASA